MAVLQIFVDAADSIHNVQVARALASEMEADARALFVEAGEMEIAARAVDIQTRPAELAQILHAQAVALLAEANNLRLRAQRVRSDACQTFNSQMMAITNQFLADHVVSVHVVVEDDH
jgi:hypothetical protein